MVCAATVSSIVGAALSERVAFNAFVFYPPVVSGLVYPIAAHWSISSNGWLAKGISSAGINGTSSNSAILDGGGCGSIHVFAGAVAAIGCYMLKPRSSRFDSNGKPRDIRGHSVPMTIIGSAIIFFGMLALNISQKGFYAMSNMAVYGLMNSLIAAAAGGVAAANLAKIPGCKNQFSTKWNVLTTINGMLSGLVAISASSMYIEPYAALIIGLVAGMMYNFFSGLSFYCKFDDPTDCIAVHLFGGMLGLLLGPFFVKETGILYAADTDSFMRLVTNLVAFGVYSGLGLIVGGVVFGALEMLTSFRVPRETEKIGADIKIHGEPAYPLLFDEISGAAHADKCTKEYHQQEHLCVEETEFVDIPEPVKEAVVPVESPLAFERTRQLMSMPPVSPMIRDSLYPTSKPFRY